MLMTNRIRSFEIAIQSRINLAIHFTDLSEKRKLTIFENLTNQLGEDSVENKREITRRMKDNEESGLRFSKLNGRQVRNLVFSAASLAGIRKPPDNVFKMDDIERMLDETVKLQRHLHELTKAAREKSE